MTTKGHQFVNTYKNPIAPGTVISTARPGEKLAAAITEIQDVISNMEGTDGKGGKFIPKLPPEEKAAIENGKVLQMQNGVEVWDWVRATG